MASPIYLLVTYAVFSCLIMFGNTFFIFLASTLDVNLASTFIKEIGLQFLKYLFSFSFLSINVIKAWRCDMNSCPTWFE